MALARRRRQLLNDIETVANELETASGSRGDSVTVFESLAVQRDINTGIPVSFVITWMCAQASVAVIYVFLFQIQSSHVFPL